MKQSLIGIALLSFVLFVKAQDISFFARDILSSGGGGSGLCNTNFAADPATNTIYAWWVSTDWNNTNGGLYTNFWYERMSCNFASAVNPATALQITNSANGLAILATPATGLTNTALAAGTNATYGIIFKLTTTFSGAYRPLWSPAKFDDGTQNGNPRGWMFNSSDNVIYWGSPFRGGTAITRDISVSSPYYIDLLLVQSNTIGLFYTNGVFSKSVSTTPPAGGWPFYHWISEGSAFQGYIREAVAWSNTVFNATSISNYHYYATNTYGYTP